ncbi:hypothetical protein AB4356_25205, partial [Vibrio lentus]
SLFTDHLKKTSSEMMRFFFICRSPDWNPSGVRLMFKECLFTDHPKKPQLAVRVRNDGAFLHLSYRKFFNFLFLSAGN